MRGVRRIRYIGQNGFFVFVEFEEPMVFNLCAH